MRVSFHGTMLLVSSYLIVLLVNVSFLFQIVQLILLTYEHNANMRALSSYHYSLLIYLQGFANACAPLFIPLAFSL